MDKDKENENENGTKPPSKKAKQEHRISSLLTRIRSKTGDNSDNKNVTKNVQVKWHRYDPLSGKFELVRTNEDRGPRFIEWKYTKTPFIWISLRDFFTQNYN